MPAPGYGQIMGDIWMKLIEDAKKEPKQEKTLAEQLKELKDKKG